MSTTKCVLEFFIPTSSFARINDAVQEVKQVLERHRGTGFFITYSGPFPDVTEKGETNERSNVGRGRGAGAAADPDPSEPDDGNDEGAEVEQPKRRGRPPGSRNKRDDGDPEAEAPRTRTARSERTGTRGEGRNGSVARGADKGSVEGDGEGEGRARSAGKDRGAERGDPEASRVAPTDDWDAEEPGVSNEEEGEDWWAKTPGDEWPDHLMPEEVDRDAVAKALTDHFTLSKDRDKTVRVLQDATGFRVLKDVDPEDYDKGLRALLKDAARIKHGVKR